MTQSPQLILRAFSSTHSAERILDHRSLVVGREEEADFVLPDVTLELSRRHFEVQWQEGHCGVVDLNSLNHTFLDGTQLLPGTWTPWGIHQQLSAGPFEFSLSEAPSAPVTIDLEKATLRVMPGASVTCNVRLTNTGDRIERLDYSIAGAPESWFQFDPPVLEINNGEAKTCKLYVQPPRAPASAAGEYALMLVVANQHQPASQTKLQPLELHVEPYEHTQVTCNPETIAAGAAAVVDIANLGNFPQEYAVHLRSLHTRLSIKQRDKHPLRVEPGKASQLQYRAFERPRRVVGDAASYGIQCEVKSTRTGVTSEQTVTVTASGCLSTWLASVLLGLLVVSGALALWLINDFGNSKAVETAQASAAIAANHAASATARAELAANASATAASATATAATGQWLVADSDLDGLINQLEVENGTDPNQQDSDDDGVDDYIEINEGLKPAGPGSRDTDGDGLEDGPDRQQCNARIPDTDIDGVGDGAPKRQEPDCRNPDTNGNGIKDGDEADPGATLTPVPTPMPTATETPIPPTPTPAPFVTTYVGNAGGDTDGCVRISWLVVGVKSVTLKIGEREPVGVAGDDNNNLVTWDRQECFDDSTDIVWDIEFHDRPPLVCAWEVKIDGSSGAKRESYVPPANTEYCIRY